MVLTKKSENYVHAIDGRLRIKVISARNKPQIAHKLGEFLRFKRGVCSVDINLVTGNALIIFDPKITSCVKLVTLLSRQGYLGYPPKIQVQNLRESKLNNAELLAEVGSAVGKEVFGMVMGVVAKHAFTALVRGLS